MITACVADDGRLFPYGDQAGDQKRSRWGSGKVTTPWKIQIYCQQYNTFYVSYQVFSTVPTFISLVLQIECEIILNEFIFPSHVEFTLFSHFFLRKLSMKNVKTYGKVPMTVKAKNAKNHSSVSIVFTLPVNSCYVLCELMCRVFLIMSPINCTRR